MNPYGFSNDSVSRDQMIVELARLIDLHLVGDGKPFKKVYDFQVADFGTNNPVCIVTGGPATRGSMDEKDKDMTSFKLWIHVFVLYESTDDNFNEEDSERLINLLEKLIADLIREYSVPTQESWFTLTHDGESILEPVPLSGVDYRHEMIPVKATCYDPWTT